MTYVEEALLLLSHADNYPRYAETTRRSGIYGPAVSMAYHAALPAARAVAAYHREKPQTHKEERKLFHRLAVLASDFPGDLARVVGDLA